MAPPLGRHTFSPYGEFSCKRLGINLHTKMTYASNSSYHGKYIFSPRPLFKTKWIIILGLYANCSYGCEVCVCVCVNAYVGGRMRAQALVIKQLNDSVLVSFSITGMQERITVHFAVCKKKKKKIHIHKTRSRKTHRSLRQLCV